MHDFVDLQGRRAGKHNMPCLTARSPSQLTSHNPHPHRVRLEVGAGVGGGRVARRLGPRVVEDEGRGRGAGPSPGIGQQGQALALRHEHHPIPAQDQGAAGGHGGQTPGVGG